MIDKDAVAKLVRSNRCLFCQQRDTFHIEWIDDTRGDSVSHIVIVTCTACEMKATRDMP